MPEVDHPGIPATIVVEDDMAEVLLEGESLGRWSLYDVHAARLVSSAFSISLDGEEITFIADEPVDFAYKGVEHMAEVWARYKAMTMPRRMVAVGRSRRGATPSRIPELREAMLANLRAVGPLAVRAPLPAPAAAEALEAASEPGLSQWSHRLEAYSNVPPPIDETPISQEPVEVAEGQQVMPGPDPDQVEEAAGTSPAQALQPPAEVAESSPAGTLEPPAELAETTEADDHVAQPSPPRLRPGPGLIPRQVTRSTPVPSLQTSEPVDWTAAWEEPPGDEVPGYEEPPPDAHLALADEPPADLGAPTDVTESVDEEAAVDEAEQAPAEDLVAGTAPREAVAEPKELVLDLGRLEIDRPSPAPVAVGDQGQGDDVFEPDLELLFAGAPMPESERSGLLGAVRSAFTRNRGTAHEHQFVEAPGGIGIVRQICTDCGYISIGVAD